MIYAVSAYIISRYFTHDVVGAILCAIPCFLIGLVVASAVDRYLSSRFPGFVYTPREVKEKMIVERQRKHDEEESKALSILENELLYPYSSLSWKYKLISDFCYDYPKLIKRLKESERYITWRTDVIDWAKDNLHRFQSFYFNDGIVDYVFDSEYQDGEMVDLNKKYGYPPDPDYEVICDIEFNNKRLPKDYFESPDLVWESEDIDDVDDYVVKKKRASAGDALAFGAGLGAGMALFGGGDSVCGGSDAGDCGGIS